MKIGSTDLSGSSSFQKTNFFDVAANKPNIYRVFPPLFSLADSGNISYFFKTHAVWVNSKNGKTFPHIFKCLLRKKDKVVVQECPLCTLSEKYNEQYKAGKTMVDAMPEGEQKESHKKQLGDFLKFRVWSSQADSKNYLNVQGTDGKIGVLRITFKHYETLKARLAQLQTEWKTDATGMTGIFLNFSKASPYKGSKDVTFAVDAFMEQAVGQNGMPQMSFKYHTINEELIQKMSTECQDLTLLYSDLSLEAVQELADNFESKEALTTICERLFPRAAPSAPAPSAPQATAPVVAQVVVPPVQPTATSQLPFNPTPFVAPVAASIAQPFNPAMLAPQAPLAQPAPVQTFTSTPAPAPMPTAPNGLFGSGTAVPQGGLSNVSEDEFARLFGG